MPAATSNHWQLCRDARHAQQQAFVQAFNEIVIERYTYRSFKANINAYDTHRCSIGNKRMTLNYKGAMNKVSIGVHLTHGALQLVANRSQ